MVSRIVKILDCRACAENPLFEIFAQKKRKKRDRKSLGEGVNSVDNNNNNPNDDSRRARSVPTGGGNNNSARIRRDRREARRREKTEENNNNNNVNNNKSINVDQILILFILRKQKKFANFKTENINF